MFCLLGTQALQAPLPVQVPGTGRLPGTSALSRPARTLYEGVLMIWPILMNASTPKVTVFYRGEGWGTEEETRFFLLQDSLLALLCFSLLPVLQKGGASGIPPRRSQLLHLALDFPRGRSKTPCLPKQNTGKTIKENTESGARPLSCENCRGCSCCCSGLPGRPGSRKQPFSASQPSRKGSACELEQRQVDSHVKERLSHGMSAEPIPLQALVILLSPFPDCRFEPHMELKVGHGTMKFLLRI